MGSLVTSAQTAFETYKSGKELASMNESELNNYNITCLKFEKAITDATEIETAFYAARDEAFAALETAYQTNRANLASQWQGFENNNFTVA